MATRSITAGRIKAVVFATAQNTLADGTVADCDQGITIDPGEITSGTGAWQADRAWSHSTIDIADTATQQVDLYDLAALDIGAGAGLDCLGQSVTLAEVTAILIYNKGPGHLEIDDTIANGLAELGDISGSSAIKQGGFLFRFEPQNPGLVVTDAAKHLVNLTAKTGEGDVSVEVHVLGRSA